jgi:hypothetical protein
MTIHKPKVGGCRNGSVCQFWISDDVPWIPGTTRSRAIEVGWIVAPGLYGDSDPHLFLGARRVRTLMGDQFCQYRLSGVSGTFTPSRRGHCGFYPASNPNNTYNILKPDDNLRSLELPSIGRASVCKAGTDAPSSGEFLTLPERKEYTPCPRYHHTSSSLSSSSSVPSCPRERPTIPSVATGGASQTGLSSRNWSRSPGVRVRLL